MKSNRQAKRDAKQLFRLCLANGLLDEGRVRDVVKRLCESAARCRFNVLSAFVRLVKIDCARRAATVQSATPLPASMQSVVQAALKRTYGPGLTLTFTESPALIGGMRIKVGSDVYDGSVQARLAALEARL